MSIILSNMLYWLIGIATLVLLIVLIRYLLIKSKYYETLIENERKRTQTPIFE